jgi:thioredoxin
MGFLKRLLGLEQRPGEPRPVNDDRFEEEVFNNQLPCFIDFFNLWCSPCQVMGGLLNEVGPLFAGRADFFKVDVNRNPAVAAHFNIRSVPTIIVVKDGEEIGRHVGLMPLNPLKAWIEAHIEGRMPGDPDSGGDSTPVDPDSDEDRGNTEQDADKDQGKEDAARDND